MTISTGTKLGAYDVTGKLGEGGMGEVWRATDTRLDREVAIKVLPPIFSGDRERLARFEREAKLLAQLHHPNIASIFGLEECEGVRALVMELVEGPTLAERLGRGPLPLDESLAIARQVTDALEEAHGKGIVHRDLKPHNIKARADGTVKVLDFGLAKAMAPANAGSDAGSQSPAILSSPTTTALPGSEVGVILGTAAYMSPEQARGGAVDKRADIWAFGVVLFEMLSGRRLFAAETVSDTLAGVLKTEVDFSAIPDGTPAALRVLLRRCLERNPKHRLHDIADARLVIDDLVAGRSSDEPAPAAAQPAPGFRRRAAVWLAALLVIGAAAAIGAAFSSRSESSTAEPMRLSLTLAPGQEILVGGIGLLEFCPDGDSLVFAGRIKGKQHLLRRRLDAREAVPIPGTEDGNFPFISPDGRWLGFIANGQMMKVAAEGGRPFPLGEQQGAGGAAWLNANTIIFAPMYSDGLFRVSADGGAVERLTTPDRAKGELGHWWPDPLPDERHVLFTGFRTPVDESRVGVLDLATNQIRWVVEGGFFGRYVPTGHLLYARGRRLYAVPFDAATATVKGSAVAVLDDLLVNPTSAVATFAVSNRGMLVHVPESLGDPPRDLVWLDRSGRATPTPVESRRFVSVSLSPDDRQAALTIEDESLDLWIGSLERGILSRLTSGKGTEFDPVWSRDGKEVFYIFDRPPFELHRIAVGAPDTGQPIWKEAPTLDLTGIAVSPDGATIAYRVSAPQTNGDLYARALDGSGEPRQIRATRSVEQGASFSPDGTWIVYESTETGRPEIYAQPFTGAGERQQLSADGGTDPIWARNGEIFYVHDGELRVVAARPPGRLDFDTPRMLFSAPIISNSAHQVRTFDVARDGSRILAITIPERSRPRQLEVITDWTRELERLVPGR